MKSMRATLHAIMILILTSISNIALSQKWECPIGQGRIKKFNYHMFSHSDPANGILVQSLESDTVRSVVRGEVLRILNYKKTFKGVLIKVNDTTFVSYFYLRETLCNEGEKIETNQTIGMASRDGTKAYQLGISVKNRDGWLDPTLYFNCK